MSTDTAGTLPDGGSDSSNDGAADVPDRDVHGSDGADTSGSGTDAARGQTHEMARHGGDLAAENRKATSEPATSSQGSRTGSLLGSQSNRTGMGDGQPTGSSQGLAGVHGNGDNHADGDGDGASKPS